jgi:inner membrane protein involved in colicin E2 resistance
MVLLLLLLLLPLLHVQNSLQERVMHTQEVMTYATC